MVRTPVTANDKKIMQDRAFMKKVFYENIVVTVTFVAIELLFILIVGCNEVKSFPVVYSLPENDNLIIFTGSQQNSSSLLVMDADTSAIWEWDLRSEDMPSDISMDAYFDWSVYHQAISLNGYSKALSHGFAFMIPLNEPPVEIPLNYLYFDHSWAPDGQQIAVSFPSKSDHSQHDIFIQNIDGDIVQQLTDSPKNERNPSWSPNSNEILYESWEFNNGLSTVNIYKTTSDGRDILELTKGLRGQNTLPKWSPDGENVAFLHSDAGSVFSLWLMDKDGSNQRVVFEVPGDESQEIRGVSNFAWSPDSVQTVFASGHLGPCEAANMLDAKDLIFCEEQVYLVNVNSGEMKRLTEKPLFGFSDVAWIQ